MLFDTEGRPPPGGYTAPAGAGLHRIPLPPRARYASNPTDATPSGTVRDCPAPVYEQVAAAASPETGQDDAAAPARPDNDHAHNPSTPAIKASDHKPAPRAVARADLNLHGPPEVIPSPRS
jgi:hypothetical protein